MKISKLNMPASLAVTALLVACGGGSSGGGGGGEGSTADIAGVWELADDSALGFDIVEIGADGQLISWNESEVDNCYRRGEGRLVDGGGDNYGFIPAISPDQDTPLVSYNLVRQGDTLRYTSAFLNIDESWSAFTAMSTSDFNLC